MSKSAWVTLATNDAYSLGALVLANSLKRAVTKHQLVILITPGVSQSMRDKLKTVFNVVQLVNVLDSQDAANLALLARPELGVTFTKLHCWQLTQYEKCVFLDADTLVLQNSDELFEREELSAAPDVGWPDCFNSGVFVFRPNVATFTKLLEFAVSKGSFDGGDQGLLNSYFADWARGDSAKRLPFIYNTCSTACYSYLPAFKKFGENVKILHFIGPMKPWLINFDTVSKTVYTPNEYLHLAKFLQLWWDIFCGDVHPKLSHEMTGLAGALAQLTLGVERTQEQIEYENQIRRQYWEAGNIDYLGSTTRCQKSIKTKTEVQERVTYEITADGRTIQKTIKSHPTERTESIDEYEQIEIDGKIVTQKRNSICESENKKQTKQLVDAQQKKSISSKQTLEQHAQYEERIVTEVTADGKTIQKIIRTYPGQITETVEETETTEVDGQTAVVKRKVTENESKPIAPIGQKKPASNQPEAVVIVPGHQKVEFDAETNTKTVTEKTTTGYQQTITTVTAEGKTFTRVKTFYDAIELPEEEVVEEEEIVEETIIEPDGTTRTTTTRSEPEIVQKNVKQIDQSRKVTDQSVSKTNTIKTNTTSTTSINTEEDESTTTSVQKTQQPSAAPTKNTSLRSVDDKNTSIDDTSVTEITEIVEETQTSVSKSTAADVKNKKTIQSNVAAKKTDEKSIGKVSDTKVTTVQSITDTDEGTLDQMAITKITTVDEETIEIISDDSEQNNIKKVNKSLETDSKKSKKTTETESTNQTDQLTKTKQTTDTKTNQKDTTTSTALVKKSVEDTRIDQTIAQLPSDAEIDASITQESTESSKVTKEANKTIKEQGRKFEQNVEIVASAPTSKTVIKENLQKEQKKQTTVSTTGQAKDQVKTEQIEVQEEYEEVQSSQVTTQKGNTNKKSITRQSTSETTEERTQKQQQLSTKSQVVKETNEGLVNRAVATKQTSAKNTKTTKFENAGFENTDTSGTRENKTIVTKADNGDVTTEEIRYFDGGREHTYRTVCHDGTIKTASKTFYDPKPVPIDPVTNKPQLPKPTGTPGKTEVKTTTDENGDVTTEEIRYFEGGREHTWKTLRKNGTTKMASKTFYDPVPVESTEEHSEETYEESVQQSMTSGKIPAGGASPLPPPRKKEIKKIGK